MDERKGRLLGAAMVLVGLAQAGVGARSADWVFAALGFAYGLVGVAQLRVAGAF